MSIKLRFYFIFMCIKFSFIYFNEIILIFYLYKVLKNRKLYLLYKVFINKIIKMEGTELAWMDNKLDIVQHIPYCVDFGRGSGN